MKSYLIASALLLGLAQPAFATGGFVCKSESNDPAIDLTLVGGISRSIPGSPFQVGGSLILKEKGLERHTIANIESVSQFWFEGGQLNIIVYNEPEAGDEFLTTTLVIKTDFSRRKGKYLGSYAVSANRDGTVKKIKGGVSCEMD